MKKISKKLTQAVLLSMALSVPFMASAEVLNEDTTYTGPLANNSVIEGATGSENITFIGEDNKQFSLVGLNGTAEIKNINDIILNGKWGGDGTVFYTNGENSNLKIDTKGMIKTDGADTSTLVFHAMGGNIVVNAGVIDIRDVGNAVISQTNGAGFAGNVTLNATGNVYLASEGIVVGAASMNGKENTAESTVNISGNNVTIENTNNNIAIGAYGNDWKTLEKIDNQNKVTINAEEKLIVKGHILANNGKEEDDAKVALDSKNIVVEGDILADTNANVTVGGDKLAEGGTAKITGNVTAKDSNVDLNLGKEGSFTGTITGDETSTTNLDLGEGSVWNVTATEDVKGSNVSAIKGARGIIRITDTGVESVQVDSVEDTDLALNGSGNITDTFGDDVAGGLADLAGKLEIGGETYSGKVTAEEGNVLGEITANVDESGNVTIVKEAANEKTMGISELNSVAYMAWRAENDEMHQRMGELRGSTGEAGVWARMKRGESEHDAMGITNQYNTYQLGYDEKIEGSDWYVGAAVSRTEGKSNYGMGSGENKATGFTVYGTNVREDGSYLDISAKYAMLDNEFEVFDKNGNNNKGDYDNHGYAFSVEYGKRIDTKGMWIEPQVQLTYGHLNGVSYTTSLGAKADQDAFESVVGRVGFAAGKDIKGGNIYVKASYLYDFDGETAVTMTNGGQSRTVTDDMGGGWFEYGVGANLNLSSVSHLYVDVERTAGGNVDTNWQWNVGLRFDF